MKLMHRFFPARILDAFLVKCQSVKRNVKHGLITLLRPKMNENFNEITIATTTTEL